MPRTVFFKLATKESPLMVLVRPGYQWSVVKWHLGAQGWSVSCGQGRGRQLAHLAPDS